MRRVAQQIGIRAPRIYKHLPHKETLQAAISTPTPRRCTARRLAMVIASRFLPPASATADRHSPGFQMLVIAMPTRARTSRGQS